jgi:hypothetical protein
VERSRGSEPRPAERRRGVGELGDLLGTEASGAFEHCAVHTLHDCCPPPRPEVIVEVAPVAA